MTNARKRANNGSGSIRKRGIRWQAQIRPKDRAAFSKSFGTKRDATNWVTDQMAIINKGGAIDTSDFTLGELIAEFMADRELGHYQTTVLDWWYAELGKRILSTLLRKDFIKARNKLVKVVARRVYRLHPLLLIAGWRLSVPQSPGTWTTTKMPLFR